MTLPDTTQDGRLSIARELMDIYGRATGLTSDVTVKRYLWTDAFAVCNYLELHAGTGLDDYLELALRLVDQVQAPSRRGIRSRVAARKQMH